VTIFKRIIRSLLLATAFTLFLAYIFIFILTFPVNYPDETLILSEKIEAFIDSITLPIKLTRLSWQPYDREILMPIYDTRVSEVSDSWQAPRPDGRSHEGQDIFADKGTPVFSATYGYIIRTAAGELGGNFVYIAGAGGRRYYYAHLDKIAEGLHRGQEVTPDTVIGFVGNTGNAVNTPYHLHFGVYANRVPVNPLPLLVNR
jgi:murein DD-endopeptidase MepM/ murein hydrolase activator NlpD